MNDLNLKKINSFFSPTLEKSVSSILITVDDEGNYELFDKYIISKKKDNTIVVNFKYSYTTKQFSTLPIAVSWCIFDKRNRISETQRIEYLDAILSGLNTSIIVHKKGLNTTKDEEAKHISLAKLSEDEHKKKILNKELTKLILDSKMYQLKQFGQKI